MIYFRYREYLLSQRRVHFSSFELQCSIPLAVEAFTMQVSCLLLQILAHRLNSGLGFKGKQPESSSIQTKLITLNIIFIN